MLQQLKHSKSTGRNCEANNGSYRPTNFLCCFQSFGKVNLMSSMNSVESNCIQSGSKNQRSAVSSTSESTLRKNDQNALGDRTVLYLDFVEIFSKIR